MALQESLGRRVGDIAYNDGVAEWENHVLAVRHQDHALLDVSSEADDVGQLQLPNGGGFMRHYCRR
jgi:hypothetical protein